MNTPAPLTVDPRPSGRRQRFKGIGWLLRLPSFIAFRFLQHERPRVLLGYAAILVAASAALIAWADPATMVKKVWETWQPDWHLIWVILLAWLGIYTPIRVWKEGVVLARLLRKNPHLLHQPRGRWNGFTYRPTYRERAQRDRAITNLRKGTLHIPDAIPLGLDEENRVFSLYLEESVRHILISGGTGAGKSTLFKMLMESHLWDKRPLLVFDFKGDRKLAGWLAHTTEEAGGTFYHFFGVPEQDYEVPHNKTQACFDPFGVNASPQAIIDQIGKLRTYTAESAIYEERDEALASTLINALFYADTIRVKVGELFTHNELLAAQFPAVVPRLEDPVIWWDRGRWGQFVSLLGEGATDELLLWLDTWVKLTDIMQRQDSVMAGQMRAFVDEGFLNGFVATVPTRRRPLNAMPRELKDTWQALVQKIAPFVQSQAGEWLIPKPDHPVFSVATLNQPGTVVLFSFNTDAEPKFSESMSTLVLAGINAGIADRRGVAQPHLLNIFIDEAQNIGNLHLLKSLCERGRDMNVALTFSMQSISQFKERIGLDATKSIIGTIYNFFLLQASIDTEEILESFPKVERLTYVFGAAENETVDTLSHTTTELGTIVSPATVGQITGFDVAAHQTIMRKRGSLAKRTNHEVYETSGQMVALMRNSADPALNTKGQAVGRIVTIIPSESVLYEPTLPRQVVRTPTTFDFSFDQITLDPTLPPDIADNRSWGIHDVDQDQVEND